MDKEKMESKQLFRCGTCKYKKRGYCKNGKSDCFLDIVDNSCSCDEYVPKRRLEAIV